MLLVARVGLTLYPQGAITSGGSCLSAYEDTTPHLERSVVEVKVTSSSFIGEDIQKAKFPLVFSLLTVCAVRSVAQTRLKSHLHHIGVQ